MKTAGERGEARKGRRVDSEREKRTGGKGGMRDLGEVDGRGGRRHLGARAGEGDRGSGRGGGAEEGT